MCASHNAEQRHINVIHSIMLKAELNEEMLQCGFHPPYREESRIFFAEHKNRLLFLTIAQENTLDF